MVDIVTAMDCCSDDIGAGSPPSPQSMQRPRAPTITIETSNVHDDRAYEGGASFLAVPTTLTDGPALKLEPGTEESFEHGANPFSFKPGQLEKLYNPKSLGAFHALGGLAGLEKGLRTNSQPATRAHRSDGCLDTTDEAERPVFTRESLAELDMPRIVNLPKLRHDVNFDRELHFRSNMDGSNGRRKMKQADQYWRALEDELVVHSMALKQRALCPADKEYWNSISRASLVQLPKMFIAIRNIPMTLVHDPKAVKDRLDVDLIVEQVRNGVCDIVEPSNWLAKVLKNDCAPMRVQSGDNMRMEITKGARNDNPRTLVSGLRQLMCLLEDMKLDVADHQIRHMRPLLIEDTVKFQQGYNAHRVARNLDVLAAQRTGIGQPPPGNLARLLVDSRYREVVRQRHTSPISQDQLAAEVKGIYAGLVIVEAKCVDIDATQAKDPHQQLGREQWQALIALHRTLLYEHHDFLMASQHPSASPSLRHLATKYNMPARMWKHGIHTFLELLRYRKPDSQEYMLSFIYLAYQMMILLYETAPDFRDTWIECLGDLARYRMAIEEEKEAHATWEVVTARLYTMASDRHPAIGRLYQHLDILDMPSLRKSCLYAKSLSCAIQFLNARASLSTLCGSIVQDEQTIHSCRSVEARILAYAALSCTSKDRGSINTIASEGSKSIRLARTRISRVVGSHLAIANFAALLEDPWSSLAHFLNQVISNGTSAECNFPMEAHGASTPSLQDHRAGTNIHRQAISSQRNGSPLLEDYQMRGLIWSEYCSLDGWFQVESSDERRLTERAATHEARAERVLWLVMYLGFHQIPLFCYQAKDRVTMPEDRLPLLTSKPSLTETRSGLSDSHGKLWILAILRTLRRFFRSLIFSLTWIKLLQSVQAAPISMLNLDETLANQSEPPASIIDSGATAIEHKALLIGSAALAVGSGVNMIQVAIRQPDTEPKISGDLAFGFSIAAWALVETHPSLTDLRNLLLALWLATESDFIARTCCQVNNARVYFWATTASGLFSSLFLAALQSDARPTLGSMLVAGLPSAAFFVSCAARILPRAVGRR